MAQANPMSHITNFFQSVASNVQQHPFAKQAASALQRFNEKQEAARRESKLPPRVVVLPRNAAVAAIIPGDSIAEQVLTNGLNNFLNLYNTALIVRLVLTWFPNPPAAIVSPLATVCDPYLNLFRGLLPPLGGSIDFSPILAFVVLNLFTNTAVALPAEVPKQQTGFSQMSKSEQLYQRRVAAARSANKSDQ